MPKAMLPVLISSTAMVLSLAGCADDCGNNVVTRIRSPDGAYDAVLFDRNCGATTGFSTQISVLPAGAPADGRGNAFIADTNHDPSMRTGAWHGPWAELAWLSPRHLRIRYVAGARPFTRETAVDDVAISYEPVPAPSPARP